MVNITWRGKLFFLMNTKSLYKYTLGKTYVGALLNTTEQNWAPPRYVYFDNRKK